MDVIETERLIERPAPHSGTGMSGDPVKIAHFGSLDPEFYRVISRSVVSQQLRRRQRSDSTASFSRGPSVISMMNF
jgi:hypothetical protein